MTELKITQADRVAAANYGLDNSLIVSADYQPIIEGWRDNSRLVQAFARHRIAAEEGKAELVDALERIEGTIMSMYFKPADMVQAIKRIARAALARVRGEG